MTFLRKRQLDTQSIDDEETGPMLVNQLAEERIDIVEQKSKSVYLNRAISQLLPLDATIITLFYQGEQSLEEIAEALNMEANTVKVKLFRARTRLKDKLERLLQHEVNELL
jgi:RNA polymerase sigma-70 factor (ECF subfamily)